MIREGSEVIKCCDMYTGKNKPDLLHMNVGSRMVIRSGGRWFRIMIDHGKTRQIVCEPKGRVPDRGQELHGIFWMDV